MYDLAAAYVRQHWDLMIPHDYITDQQERLGGWLARQRELYRRKELEPRRIRRLEQLGIQWEPKKMRQRRYLEAARAYQKAEGSLEVPFNYITKDGLRLGGVAGCSEEALSGRQTGRSDDTGAGRAGNSVGTVFLPVGRNVFTGTGLL